MKQLIWSLLVITISAIPSVSLAKGAPLFFQTGDELFEIAGAPKFKDGYSVGYACKRFGLLGADLWTWDCELMAINIDAFSVAALEPAFKAEMEAQYSPGDRVRNPWNHYGAAVFAVALIGGIALKQRS